MGNTAEKEDKAIGGRRFVTGRNLLYWLKVLYRESPGFVWLYLAGIGAAVGVSWLGVYMPSVLVTDITRGESLEKIFYDLAFLGGGLLVLHLLINWMERTKQILEVRISLRQTLRIAEISLNVDYDNVEKSDFPNRFWQLVNRHLWSGEYAGGFLQAFAAAATAIIGMALYIGMLSGLSLWILLVVIGGTAVNYWVGIRCNKWDAANRHKWLTLDYKMVYLSRSTSSYEAAKDVHLYWMPPWLRKLFNQELNQRLKYTVRQQANYFLGGTVNGFCQMIWEGTAYIYLIYLVCRGELDAGGFVFYFGIITGFASWCSSVVYGMKGLHEEASYVEEERQFLSRLQKSSGGGKEKLILQKGHVPEISFVNVSFQYEGAEAPVLRNFNLTLRPGENIALVGLNGAGKTTFIKLLCGFYDPTEGRILIDGRDRSRYDRESWLNCFSGVFQDGELFPLSLEENLVLGGKKEEGRLRESLKMADLEEKISRLPGGLKTLFGKGCYEDAVEFSGGELQKMMLARALYKQAPILVLDEPTAALDPLMESQLYQKYRSFSRGRTTVFISHRLASTRFCDRIVLIEEGTAAETGTHEELLARDGRYAWMFGLQSRYYRKKEEQREAGLEGEEV